jgi:hypothetical protein
VVAMSARTLRPRRRKPDAPRILSASVSAGLTWSRPSDGGAALTEFRIYENGSLLDVTDAGTLAFSGTPSVGASYRVSAVNAEGESAQSSAVVGTA